MKKQELLSTSSYKGVRDFYPSDMAVQRYIFDTWGKTAESYGFERYDASILESSELYKAKGAENEEMVNEQTYTFIDRGEREVTLRPEMTPTVARMVVGKKNELHFPVRWYSIPNLFRYERPQRGRLREHWQLNCDIFGTTDYTTDVEIIALASDILCSFGATPDMFEIRVNDRREMSAKYLALGIADTETQDSITRLNDRFYKISESEYKAELLELVKDASITEDVYALVSGKDTSDSNTVVGGLRELGITNVKIDRSIARGFNYYTGTIFEVYDVSGENNRAMLGGGRYDNLASLFTDEQISGIGFGMGDVTMRDFLETHKLLPESVRSTAPKIMVIPQEESFNLAAQKVAKSFRQKGHSSTVDNSTRKLGKKIGIASDTGVEFIVIVGENEVSSDTYTLKKLANGIETTGKITELFTVLD